MNSNTATGNFSMMSMFEYQEQLPVIQVDDTVFKAISTSKGNQSKWYLSNNRRHVKDSFHYNNENYKDYICEDVARKIGLQLGFDISAGNACVIEHTDGRQELGSYSESFLNEDEIFISFYTLLKQASLGLVPWEKYSTADRICVAAEIYESSCGLDASKYLFDMISLDYLIGNEDRHMNNFGVIYNAELELYRLPPIYDSGLALFEHDTCYRNVSLITCMRKMKGRPFSVDFAKSFAAAQACFGYSLSGTLQLDEVVFPSMTAWRYVQYVLNKIGIAYIGKVHVIQ